MDFLNSDDVNSISDAVEPDTVVKEKTVTDQLKKMINSGLLYYHLHHGIIK